MNGITDYLISKSNGMLNPMQEVADNTGVYSMFDDGGVEVEVGEFLYGFVRMLKPLRVLTTGIYTGISDMYIAKALVDNKRGRSTALEFEKFHLERAKKLWDNVGVDSVIESILTPSLKYEPSEKFQMMFLDTEPQIRFQELIKFYPYLEEGGYVFIHDLNGHMSQHPNEQFFGWPFGTLPKEIINLVQNDAVRPFHFATPRGFTAFYKPRPTDFKWR